MKSRPFGPGRRTGHGPELARLRHFAVRQRRPRRRPGAGDALARARQHQFVRARLQYAGLAVHHLAEPVSVRVPQAPARGRRRRRDLCPDPEIAARAERPCGISGVPHGAQPTAAGSARGADPGRCLRASPTKRPQKSAAARSAPSRAGSTAPGRVSPTCCRSRAWKTSDPTLRRGQSSPERRRAERVVPGRQPR